MVISLLGFKSSSDKDKVSKEKTTSNVTYLFEDSNMNDVIAKDTYVIVVGNEKGGAGKTTLSTHLIVSLLDLGFSVGSIDLDSRQLSLSRYIENRRNTAESRQIDIPLPSHAIVKKSRIPMVEEAKEDEKRRLFQCLRTLSSRCDFLVIDTPGSDTYMSSLAHSFANTIVTPINDSFIDLDVLARVNGDNLEIDKPGIYSEMIWEQKIARAKRDHSGLDWVVVRLSLIHI